MRSVSPSTSAHVAKVSLDSQNESSLDQSSGVMALIRLLQPLRSIAPFSLLAHFLLADAPTLCKMAAADCYVKETGTLCQVNMSDMF